MKTQLSLAHASPDEKQLLTKYRFAAHIPSVLYDVMSLVHLVSKNVHGHASTRVIALCLAQRHAAVYHVMSAVPGSFNAVISARVSVAKSVQRITAKFVRTARMLESTFLR